VAETEEAAARCSDMLLDVTRPAAERADLSASLATHEADLVARDIPDHQALLARPLI
jgi:hypothetical protein